MNARSVPYLVPDVGYGPRGWFWTFMVWGDMGEIKRWAKIINNSSKLDET